MSTGNLALNKPITATSGTHPANAANDGNAQTYYESVYTLPQSLTVDLVYAYSVNRLILKMPSNFPDRTLTLTVQGSTDNSTFFDIVASASYPFLVASGNIVTVTLPATSARYVRLYFTGNTSRTSAQLGELEVYADSNAADLIATDITWSPSNPKEGDAVTFSAVVKNIGLSATPEGVGHTAAFKIDGTTVASTAPYSASIAPGGTATLTATSAWTAIRYKFDIQAIVNSTGTVGESNALNNDDYFKSLTVAGSGWQSSFNIKESLGIYEFPEETIGYPLTFAGYNVTPDHIRLRQYGQSSPLVYQLANVSLNGSGFLTGATIYFRTGLNFGVLKRYTVDWDSSYSPSFDNPVTFSDNGDGTATIAGNEQQIKVPYGNVNLNGAALSSVPAPLLALSRQPGSWIGSGSFSAPAGINVSSLNGRVTEQGPLFIKYTVTYTINNGRIYNAEMTVRHGEKYVTVDETYEGFLSSHSAFLRFSYKNGVDPDGRIVMQNGGYIRTTSGGRSGLYGEGADSSGKLPYELGIYAVNSNNLARSTSFWKDSGSEAILFATYRLKDWKTETRQIYNAYIKQNLRFYSNATDKYMEASIEGTERHWALSVIPRSQEVLSGRRMSDMVKPPDALIDTAWTNIPTSVGQQPGTAPDVKLWQKLADFSLDGYKDMVFDFPEDASRTLPIPGYNNVPIADPNDYWTDKYSFSPFRKFYNLTDKYWDVSSDLGPTGNFGRAARYLFSDYAYNRGNWGYDERKRTRSLLVFMGYLAAGDNNLPHTSMLSGHPNFNLDVKQTIALAAGAFPEHPHAASWKAAFLQDYDECFAAYMRQFNASQRTEAGRWYENLPTYANASLMPMMAAQASLISYDQTDIFAHPGFKTLLRWVMNSLSPNERASFRTPVPVGAHASGGDPGGEFDGIYRLLADRAALSDPLLGSQMLWSATNGAQGVNPQLQSTVYTDFGPVLRYDFGGPNEAFLYLQQLTGPGYRWSPSTNGAVYYAAKGKRYSWSGGEDSGDYIDLNKLPLFQLNGKSLGDHKADGILYNFGEVQYYNAAANGSSAPYLSRGILMVRGDYIGIYDDLSGAAANGAFQWTNRETGLKARYYNNTDFTDLRSTRIDNSRFPGTGSWGPGLPDPALSPDTYSIAWTGLVWPKFSESYTFSATVGAGDSAKIYVNGTLAVDTAAGTSTPIAMSTNQFYEIRIEYVHYTGSSSIQWKWSSASQGLTNVDGLLHLSWALDQTPMIYTVKDGPGDEFHLVAPEAISVSNQIYGAIVANNEYVFASDTVQNVSSGSVVFNGRIGYAEAQRIALFDGTAIGYGDLVLERAGGDFGASAEAVAPDRIEGRIAGRSGGTLTVTLPAAFTAQTVAVTVGGNPVPSTKSGNKVAFNVSIAQSDGVKAYAIEPGTATEPLFSDSFEDGDANGWTVTAGTWNVAPASPEKVYATTGGAVTAGNAAWSSYLVKAKVKLAGSATADLMGRYSNGNNFYYLQLDGGANRLKLYKKAGGAVALLSSVAFAVTPGQWYELQLGMSGASLSGAVDGNNLISVTDGSLTAGKIGLRSSGEATFDDIVVY
ncbi:discoidin domain-containing protein [Cohnella faecalis]|uniref:PA14 domain-containing protein n=1 Tax=Cohnella faecalis TaxID=2315694 RepID=A0A398CV62_9BACL|nr:discoidin domain-containing protein [Cohnella faecalis]RIE03777.1 hypothetical protein D3H35_09495 [Cohnella faecalis]